MTVFAASTASSQLLPAVSADSLRGLLNMLPSSSRLIVPVQSLATTVQHQWAAARPGEPLPIIQTLPSFLRSLAVRFLDPTLTLIDEVEAELLLQRALELSGERFRPSGLTLARIIRWKQEQQTMDRVAHEFPAEGRSADLRDLDRVLKVWGVYEDLKGGSTVDRGDVSLHVVDALAALETLPEMAPIVLAGIHGLSETDKLTFHLLARHGVDCGIRFADHVDEKNRSSDVAIWLQGHGWTTSTLAAQESTASIVVKSMPSPREEVRRVLAATKEHVIAGGSIADVAIVLPSDGSYDAMTHAEALSASIPVQMSRRKALANHPSVTAIKSVCDVVLDRWTNSSIDHLSSSTAISAKLSLGRLAESAATFRILGGEGAEAWLQKIQRSREALQSLTSDIDRSVTSLVQLAREAESTILTLQDMLGNVSSSLTSVSFVTWISDVVMNKFGIQDLPEIQDSLDKYDEYCSAHDQSMATLREHVARWWTVVSSIGLADRTPLNSGVAVVRANELRYRSFARVFALGLIEGILPRKKDDPIERALLPDQTMVQDRETLADVLCAVRTGGTLVALWPATRGGDPTLASRFLDDLREQDVSGNPLKTEYVSIEETDRELHLSVYDVAASSQNKKIDLQDRQLGLVYDQLPADVREEIDVVLKKPLGPSRIDAVSSCPYAYYAKHILKLEEPLDIDERLSGLERGTLMHNVAQRFFEGLQGYPTSAVSSVDEVASRMVTLDGGVDDYVDQLHACFEVERAKLPQGYLYDDVERSMYSDTDDREGLLRRWILSEIKTQESSEFRPVLFEVDYDGPIQFKEGLTEQVKLRIDRIDARLNGKGLELRLVDYKTGSNSLPTELAIASGISTQMPLYAASAVAWFKQNGIQATVAEYAYHTFGRSSKNQKDPRVKTSVKIELLAKGLENATESVENLRNARFPVRPLKGACTYCAYSEVCRIEHWGIESHEVIS